MASNPKWVNLLPSAPADKSFATTGGLGTPINIDDSTAFGYYLNRSGVVKILGGALLGYPTRVALASAPTVIGYAYLTEAGREGAFVWSSADNSANVTADPQQGVYVPPTGTPSGAAGAWVRKYSGGANLKWFGAKFDGATDDTTANNAAMTLVNHVYAPAGTSIVTAMLVPANTYLETAGFGTRFKQKSATGPNTRIVNVTGSNVTIGDLSVEGQLNQAGDTTGEQNIGVFVQATATTGNLTNVKVGNINAKNIRGDAIFVGAAATYSLTDVSWGDIICDNIYRNGLTVDGAVYGFRGGSIVKAPAATKYVGYQDFDLEPDLGTGTSLGGYIAGVPAGCHCSVVGPSAADYIDGLEIGYLNLKASNYLGSSPAYAAGVALTSGLYIRNTKYVKIAKGVFSGYDGPGVKGIYNVGELTSQTVEFGQLETSDCSRVDATYYGHVSFALGVHKLIVHSLKQTVSATGTNPGRSGVISAECDIGRAEVVVDANLSFLRNCYGSTVRNLVFTGAGYPYIDMTNLVAINGSVAATATNLAAFCTGPMTFIGYDVTATAIFNAVTKPLVINSKLNGTYYRAFTNNETYQIDDIGNYMIVTSQVVGTRKTGWAVDTGTAKRTANATYAATANAAYVQADIQTLMNAVRDLSQTVKALKDDLHNTAGHGLIGT